MADKQERKGPGIDPKDRSVIVPLEPSANLIYEQKESPTAAAAAEIRELIKQGKRVFDFTQGRPEPPAFQLPRGFHQGKIDAINRGKVVYTPPAGFPELRGKLAEDFFRETGIPYIPEEVMLGFGGRGPINLTLKALIDKNQDEILVFSPLWPPYLKMIKDWFGKPIIYELKPPDFQIDFARLRRYVMRARLAAVMINEPNNPTSKLLFSQRTLNAIVRMVEDRNDLYPRNPAAIIFDSLYEDLIFDPAKRIHFPNTELFKARAIIIKGVSKTFNATGLRLGWAFGPSQMIGAMTLFQQDLMGNAPSDSQYALYLALTEYPEETRRGHLALMKKHRARLEYTINELGRAGVEFIMPDAAFYLLAKVPVGPDCRYQNDREFVGALLRNKGVGVVAGSEFLCPDYVRFSLAVSWETLRGGIRGFIKFIEETVAENKRLKKARKRLERKRKQLEEQRRGEEEEEKKQEENLNN